MLPQASAPQVKAIPTHYRGVDFRSRLEARWAIWMDSLRIQWEYERDGFEDEHGLRYLPDFYLTKAKCYLEIKPVEPDAGEIRKAWLPVYATGCDLYICHGMPPSSLENDAAMYRGFHLEREPVPGCGRCYVQSIGAQWTKCEACGCARPVYGGMTEKLGCCGANPGHSGANMLDWQDMDAAARDAGRYDFRWNPA